jgi:hypothetical protein
MGKKFSKLNGNKWHLGLMKMAHARFNISSTSLSKDSISGVLNWLWELIHWCLKRTRNDVFSRRAFVHRNFCSGGRLRLPAQQHWLSNQYVVRVIEARRYLQNLSFRSHWI